MDDSNALNTENRVGFTMSFTKHKAQSRGGSKPGYLSK